MKYERPVRRVAGGEFAEEPVGVSAAALNAEDVQGEGTSIRSLEEGDQPAVVPARVVDAGRCLHDGHVGRGGHKIQTR